MEAEGSNNETFATIDEWMEAFKAYRPPVHNDPRYGTAGWPLRPKPIPEDVVALFTGKYGGDHYIRAGGIYEPKHGTAVVGKGEFPGFATTTNGAVVLMQYPDDSSPLYFGTVSKDQLALVFPPVIRGESGEQHLDAVVEAPGPSLSAVVASVASQLPKAVGSVPKSTLQNGQTVALQIQRPASKASRYLQASFEELSKLKPYDLNDPYYFTDFLDQFNGKRVNLPIDQAKEYVALQARRVVRHIVGTSAYYLKMTATNPFLRMDKGDCFALFPNAKFITMKDNPQGEPTAVYTNILCCLAGNDLYSTTTVFKPFHLDLPLATNIKEEFNQFPGFVSKLVIYDLEVIKPILDHIRNVWANGNEYHYRYILSCLAYPIRMLKSSGVVLCLVGPQGTGKSIILGELFMKYIYGVGPAGLSHSTSGLDDILGRFNSHLEGKMFIVVNEAEATGGSEDRHFGRMFNKFKNYITDDHIAYEGKGREVRTGVNIGSYFICTQHKASLLIEGKDDRRFAIFETPATYKGDYGYFNKLASVCNQDTANHLYSYFRSPAFDEINIDVRKIPLTPVKEEIVTRTTPYAQAFIENILNAELPVAVDQIKFYKGDPVLVTNDWYATYLEWLETQDRNARGKNLNIFTSELKKYTHFEKFPDQIRIPGVGKFRCFKILESAHDLIDVEFKTTPDWLATYLREKDPPLPGVPTVLSPPFLAPLSIYLKNTTHTTPSE